MKRKMILTLGILVAGCFLVLFGSTGMLDGGLPVNNTSYVYAKNQDVKYEYDSLGRVSTVRYPDGTEIKYEYDANGNLLYSRESKKQILPDDSSQSGGSTQGSGAYTKEGLLKKVTDGGSQTVVEYTYDETGNKTKEVEKNKDGKKLSELHYEYDKAGNVTKQTQINVSPKEGEPESRSVEYQYYPNGKLNYTIDAAGNRTTYSYDKSWRVQTIVSDTEPTVTYRYDPAGRVLSETVGSGGEEDSITTTYTYDIYGNVASATDAEGNTTQYRYDGNGSLTETEDAAHRVFYSRYDALNRVVETGMRAPGAGDIPLTRLPSGS